MRLFSGISQHVIEVEKKDDFCYEGGIMHFVEDLSKSKNPVFSKPVYFDVFYGDNEVEVALQYTDSYNEEIYAFANNINTEEGVNAVKVNIYISACPCTGERKFALINAEGIF